HADAKPASYAQLGGKERRDERDQIRERAEPVLTRQLLGLTFAESLGEQPTVLDRMSPEARERKRDEQSHAGIDRCSRLGRALIHVLGDERRRERNDRDEQQQESVHGGE